MNRFFNGFYERTGLVKDAGQRNVISRVSSLIVEGTLVFSLLGTLGVDTSPIIATAGVAGATIGFASKDFGANFVASIALSGHRAINMGSNLTIGVGTNAVSGKVVKWDTRYLYLESPKKDIVHVPNSLVLTSVVTLHDAATEPKWVQNEREWKASVASFEKDQQANGASKTQKPDDAQKK